MGKLILGIDAGNYMAKVAGPYGVMSGRSAIVDWFARDIEETFGPDDLEFEINGRKGFSGTIAAYEDVNSGGAMYGNSKAHDDTLIRVLLGAHRYIEKNCPGVNKVSVVTGQPIVSHKASEKEEIINMLKGRHDFSVNGMWQRIEIEEVGIIAEGSGAFWSDRQEGKVRIIDCGSGTVNCATIIDNRHINNASATFNFGVETSGKDLAGLARDVIRSTTSLKWEREDKVLVCGGVANDILPYMAGHYKNARTVTPQLRLDSAIQVQSPIYANAIGFYELGRLTYK